ncbi:MAG: hypothetical protein IPJ06_17265 [Saprospiraceae bacterium]|nr:hypothetical protein [Saprospiraceae bacterium]
MDDPQKSSYHFQKAMEVAFEESDTSILEEYNRIIKHIALLRSEVELSEVNAPNLESYRNWAIGILTEIVERSNRNVPDSHLLSQIGKILTKDRTEAYVEGEEVVEVEIGNSIRKTLDTEWEQSGSSSELPSGHRELIVSEVSKLKNGLKAILYQELLCRVERRRITLHG